MNKIMKLAKDYSTLYGMFGIYVDWQIDHNIVLTGRDPHGINTFDDFLNVKTFQIVTVTHNNQEKLVIDLCLPYYKQMAYTRLNTRKTLSLTLSGWDAENMLKHYSSTLNLPILDILSYYLGKIGN